MRALFIGLWVGLVACGGAPPGASPVTIDVYGVGASPRVALGDLDGDGRVDLVAAFGDGRPDGGIIVRRGVGDGTFGEARRVLVGAVTFAVADVDRDGRADIVVDDGWNLGVLDGGEGPMRVVARVRGGRLLAATAAGAITVEADGSLDTRAWSTAEDARRVDPSPLAPVAAADVDGDGALDLVGVAFGALAARRNDAWSPVRLLEATALDDVIAADLDGDGAADAITWGRGRLVASGRHGLVLSTPIPGDVRVVAVADLDRDRRPDLVLVAPSAVIARCAALAFGPCARARGPWADPSGVAAADLDGDARPELVISDRATSSVTVVQGL